MGGLRGELERSTIIWKRESRGLLLGYGRDRTALDSLYSTGDVLMGLVV